MEFSTQDSPTRSINGLNIHSISKTPLPEDHFHLKPVIGRDGEQKLVTICCNVQDADNGAKHISFSHIHSYAKIVETSHRLVEVLAKCTIPLVRANLDSMNWHYRVSMPDSSEDEASKLFDSTITIDPMPEGLTLPDSLSIPGDFLEGLSDINTCPLLGFIYVHQNAFGADNVE